MLTKGINNNIQVIVIGINSRFDHGQELSDSNDTWLCKNIQDIK